MTFIHSKITSQGIVEVAKSEDQDNMVAPSSKTTISNSIPGSLRGTKQTFSFSSWNFKSFHQRVSYVLVFMMLFNTIFGNFASIFAQEGNIPQNQPEEQIVTENSFAGVEVVNDQPTPPTDDANTITQETENLAVDQETTDDNIVEEKVEEVIEQQVVTEQAPTNQEQAPPALELPFTETGNHQDTNNTDTGTVTPNIVTDTGTVTPDIVTDTGVTQPVTFTTTTAQGCAFLQKGYDVKNCQSANIIAIGTDMTYCSAIAVDNLQYLTKQSSDLPTIGVATIQKGDAKDLLQAALANNTVNKLDSCGALAQVLKKAPLGAIADVYLHNTKGQESILDYHRFIAFNAEDGTTYVLDPIRGTKTTAPQKLATYRWEACKDSDVYVNKDFYFAPEAIALQNKKEFLNVTNTNDLITLALQGKILGFDIDEISKKPRKASFLSNIRFLDPDGVKVELPAGLEVKAKFDAPLDTTALGISDADLSNFTAEKIADIKGSTKFGIPGQHLIFSKPVKLEIPVATELEDGTLVRVQVKHEGETEYGTVGLTSNPDALCNADGSASEELDPVSVKDGVVTFYTCGASTFVINAAGNGNIAFWLSATTGVNCTTNGCTLLSWEEKGANAFANAVNGPTYSTNAINYNPAVTFDGTNDHFTLPAGYADFTNGMSLFVVAQPTANKNFARFIDFGNGPAASNILLAREGVTNNLQYDAYNGSTTNKSILNNAITNDVFTIYGVVAPGGSPGATVIPSFYLNGKNMNNTDNAIVPANVNRTLNYIGRSNWPDEYYKGDIAEIIMYKNDITGTGLEVVESYLALKYGITLGGSGSSNKIYRSSDQSILRYATGGFHNDVAGIGRDDFTTLNQKQATSSSDTMITIGIGSIATDNASNTGVLNDNNFMLWGNNGASKSWANAELVGQIGGEDKFRLSRIRQVKEKGTIGSVQVRINATTFNNIPNPFIIVSSDTDFDTTDTMVPLTWDGTNWNANIDFSDGQYFALGGDAISAPGGRRNGLAYWLKADNGPVVNVSQNLTNWIDQSADPKNAGTVNSDPQLIPNGLNYNPVVNFDGNDYFGTNLAGDLFMNTFTGGEVFVVTKQTTKGGNAGYPFHLGGGAHAWYTYNNLGLYNTFGTTTRKSWYPHNNVVIEGGGTTSGSAVDTAEWNLFNMYSVANDWKAYFNGQLAYSTTTNTTKFTTENGYRYIGANAGAPYYGDVAEIIMYNRKVATDERAAINTYLALKYGITLVNNQNYILSDGTIAWTGMANSGYNQNIFGIARDDKSSLYQKQSKSNGIDAFVHIGIGDIAVTNAANTGTLDNLSSLIIGDNGGQNMWTSNEAPAGRQILGRTWKVAEVGNVGPVKITVPDNSSSEEKTLPSENGKVYLLVDDDGNFQNGGTTETELILDGNMWNTTVDLSEGQYFTFATQGTYAPAGIDNSSGYVNGVKWELYNGYDSTLTDGINGALRMRGYTNRLEHADDINLNEISDNFSMRLRTKLLISNAGNYVFRLNTDDLGALYVNGNLAIDTHLGTDSAPIALIPGYHDIEIRYSEANGAETLNFQYQGPDQPTMGNIPGTRLFTNARLSNRYKADTLSGADGSLPSYWYDASSNHSKLSPIDPTAIVNKTSLRLSGTGMINYNPTVDIQRAGGYGAELYPNNGSTSENGYYQNGLPWDRQSRSIFVVAKTDRSDISQYMYAYGRDNADRQMNALRALNNDYSFVGKAQDFNPDNNLVNVGTPNIFAQYYTTDGSNNLQLGNNGVITNSTTLTLYTRPNDNKDLEIGAMPDVGEAWDGQIAEVITYPWKLSNEESLKVNSYLAMKYGITLSQSVSGYVDSTNKIIYSDKSYRGDVAAIARDDASVLYQKQSQSSNPTNIVSMAVGTFATNNPSNTGTIADNNSYLFWGHNGSGVSTWTGANVMSGYKRIERLWKVSMTGGSIGPVSVQFDVNNWNANIPGKAEGSNYYLVVDTNNDGNLSNDTPIEMTGAEGLGNASLWTAGGIQFQDGQLFTIAVMNDTDIDKDGVPNTVECVSPDYVFGDQIPQTFRTWKSNGDGTWNTVPIVTTRSVSLEVGYEPSVSTFAVDVNNDSKVDFVGMREGNDRIEVALGTGDGLFVQNQNISSQLTDHQVGDDNLSATRMGDVDNDGNIDLVVGSQGNWIQVWRGRGDGSFQNATVQSSATTMRAGVDGNKQTFLYDVTNDGNLDWVVTRGGGDLVRVWKGLGDARFDPSYIETSIPGLNGGFDVAKSILMGDITNDGKLDLIETFQAGYGDYFKVYAGNGSGGFSSTPISTLVNASNIGYGPIEQTFLGDFNQDGSQDVLFARGGNGTESMSVYLSNGDGTFALTPIVTNMPTTFDAGYDHNRYGALIENKSDSDNDGFSNCYDKDDDNDGVPTASEFTGDTDGDGILDYLDKDDDGDGYTTKSENTNGNENWFDDDADDDGIPSFLDANESGGIDLDGDSIPNSIECKAPSIIFASDGPSVGGSDFTRRWNALGDGSIENRSSVFSQMATTFDVGMFNAVENTFISDQNNDGYADLVWLLDGTNRQIRVYPGNASGVFDSNYMLTTVPTTFNAGQDINQYTDLVDVDEDGIRDIVNSLTNGPFAGLNNNAISVWKGLGNGYFSTTPIVTSFGISSYGGGNDLARASFFTDVNKDGKVDYVYALEFNYIRVYLGNGNGTFSTNAIETAEPTMNVGTSTDEVTRMADVDNDGDPDLIFAFQSNETISVYKNNGNGTFGNTALTSTIPGFLVGDGGGEISWFADMNEDGNTDLVHAYIGGGAVKDEVRVFYGNGDGTFQNTFVSTFMPDETWDIGGGNARASLLDLAQLDTDGDGTPNCSDIDDDGDGVPSNVEKVADPDSDGIPAYLDIDDDNDGIITKIEDYGTGNATAWDSDNDGTPDYLDNDDDNDGLPTKYEYPDPNLDNNLSDAYDLDNNGIPSYLDPNEVVGCSLTITPPAGETPTNFLFTGVISTGWTLQYLNKGTGENITTNLSGLFTTGIIYTNFGTGAFTGLLKIRHNLFTGYEKECTDTFLVNIAECGDSIIGVGETCDDGNLLTGDGCSDVCTLEAGATCAVDIAPAIGTCDTTGSGSVSANYCGNGIIAGTETCEDGNTLDNDGCNATCTIESGFACAVDILAPLGVCDTTGIGSVTSACGNGSINTGEICDDGNIGTGDGCSNICTLEEGATCIDTTPADGICDTAGSGSVTANYCGNGLVAGTEACDDNNTNFGDGCSASCTIETGYSCAGTPSVCTVNCGNAVIDTGELCDDGNLTNSDGCSASCTLEAGAQCAVDVLPLIGVCDTAGSGSVLDDTTAPVTPTVGPSTTTDDTPVLSGTCESGSVVIVSGATCSPNPQTCSASGTWTCAVTTPLATGANTISVTSCDAANNCSTTTGTVTVSLGCGNGVLDINEQCDDNNTNNGDGCSNVCALEAGAQCSVDILPIIGICDTVGSGSVIADDQDGVSISIENAGPNSGDANMDGILDSQQSNVATFISPITNSYMTLVITGGCQIINGVYHGTEAQNETQNPVNDFSIGMHGFALSCDITGATVNITYIRDQLYDTSLWLDYEKYNPNTQQYFSIKHLVSYGVFNGRTTVTYPITDGGQLDNDAIANRAILDPAGPIIINKPSITGPSSGAIVTGTSINIVGTGTPGTMVTITNGSGIIVATGIINASGTFSIPTPLTTGSNSFTVSGPAGTGNTTTVIVPSIPVITETTSGTVATGTTSITLTGTGTPGTIVTITNGSGQVVGTGIINGSGIFTVTVPVTGGDNTFIPSSPSGSGTPVTINVPVTTPIVVGGTSQGGSSGGGNYSSRSSTSSAGSTNTSSNSTTVGSTSDSSSTGSSATTDGSDSSNHGSAPIQENIKSIKNHILELSDSESLAEHLSALPQILPKTGAAQSLLLLFILLSICGGYMISRKKNFTVK